jgi:hypothetical protein
LGKKYHFSAQKAKPWPPSVFKPRTAGGEAIILCKKLISLNVLSALAGHHFGYDFVEGQTCGTLNPLI